MAFATTSSAFGIKPSSSSSVFGTKPSSSTTGAFGASSQPTGSNPSPFGAFATPSSQHSGAPSLFGGLGQGQSQNLGQNQNQPALGGLFGQQPTQQQPQQRNGGLFGGSSWGGGTANVANAPAQPTQGGFGSWGLSGSQPQTQQQQPQQQQSTGFGSSNVFGTASNQPQLQPQTGGLWGNNSTQNTGQSLFGQSASNPATQSQQQPPPFTRTTKFNDLPDQVQKLFESIDTHIQGRIQISTDLKARSLGEEPTKAAELIRKVHNDLVNTMSNLQADKAIAEELKSKVDMGVQDTIITAGIIDGFRNPQQNGSYLKNHAGFPLEYFTRAAEDIRKKLQWYKSTVEQIERRLASAQNQVQYNPQAITATLQAQNATFISLAGKTAELHAELQKVKSAYRELWRAHTGSARDPFNEIDRRPGDGDGLLGGVGFGGLSGL